MQNMFERKDLNSTKKLQRVYFAQALFGRLFRAFKKAHNNSIICFISIVPPSTLGTQLV